MKHFLLITIAFLISTQAHSEVIGDWNAGTFFDDMTEEKKGKASTDDPDNGRAVMFVCKDTGLNVLGIILGETFSAPGMEAELLFKIDDNKAIRIVGITNGYTAVGVKDGFEEVINQMKAGRYARVRATSYDYTEFNFKVSLKGFTKAYNKIQNYCSNK